MIPTCAILKINNVKFGSVDRPSKKAPQPHHAIAKLNKAKILCSFVLPYIKRIKARTVLVKQTIAPDISNAKISM